VAALDYSEESQEVKVNGKPLECLVCGTKRFQHRRAQLNTAAATFFHLDWANRSADCVVCADCGYIHWFLQE
jgi:hypothetical protein